MPNVIINSIYFDDCDGEIDSQPVASFSFNGIDLDMVFLNDSFMIDTNDNESLESFGLDGINAINLAIKNHIKNEKKLDDNDEKINTSISNILKKTNVNLKITKKNNSYIVSKFDEELDKWNILQILDNRVQTEYFLENLLKASKKKVKRLNANISYYLHDLFRQKCLDEKVDMQEVLEDMISNYVY